MVKHSWGKIHICAQTLVWQLPDQLLRPDKLCSMELHLTKYYVISK